MNTDQIMSAILQVLPETPAKALCAIAEILDPLPMEMRELSDKELLDALEGEK